MEICHLFVIYKNHDYCLRDCPGDMEKEPGGSKERNILSLSGIAIPRLYISLPVLKLRKESVELDAPVFIRSLFRIWHVAEQKVQ